MWSQITVTPPARRVGRCRRSNTPHSPLSRRQSTSEATMSLWPTTTIASSWSLLALSDMQVRLGDDLLPGAIGAAVTTTSSMTARSAIPHSRRVARTSRARQSAAALLRHSSIEASGAGDCAGRQTGDMCCDLARPRQPDLVPVAQDVLHGTPELPEAERLSQDEGVQHERADQRLSSARLLEHLVELVDPRGRQLHSRVLAHQHHRRVVGLDRIRHIQDLAAPRAQPDGLIIERPVALIEVTGFLQQIERLP